MIIECDRCYARYRYDEARFEGKVSKKVRCTKCLAIFEIFRDGAPETTGSAAATKAGEDTVLRSKKGNEATAKRAAQPASRRPPPSELKMPADSRVALAVIAGPEAGRIYAVEKPRVIVGRHDADINVDDPEISRQHAAIEVAGETVTLVDLGSSNGTFVGEERIREWELANQAEFSIGGSTLMLILTAKG
ncbi:MAG: zinc-ribbon domain-containing protein [Acidobacteriota bacterium]|nr:zinc-ribbon domain-containing protein [Acidobacteriota bacterium]